MAAWPERFAFRWGEYIAAYGNFVTRRAQLRCEGLENVAGESTIWFGFHSANLLALALHRRVTARAVQALVPPGIVGAAMRGWLTGVGVQAQTLPKDGTGNPQAALKAMARALTDGDVVIAVDGPHGPSGRVKPGAFWLARLTGCNLITVGIAARPAFRFPRWDRHLIPLPGARLAAVISKPFKLSRDQQIDGPFLDEMGKRISDATRRAWEIV